MTRETIIHIAATIFVASAIALIIAGLYWALREQNEPLAQSWPHSEPFPKEYSAADEAYLVVEQYLERIKATL